MKINAFAACAPKEELKSFTYERTPKESEIVVSVQSCSLTRGDIRFIDNYWNDTKYPMIPGLEIIGKVTEIGNDVKDIMIGDIVGIGYQVASCMTCEYCLSGKEQFCLKQQLIPVHEYGGLADTFIVDHRFAFKMPENLQGADATPLLCSGLTPFAAIKKCKVQKDMNVGVVGVGSLGHLAIQFLSKMGCNVTAFSHALDKSETLKNLGASSIILSTDEQSLQKLERQFDFIISTSAGSLPWEKYIKMLRPEGTLCFVGLPPEPISFKAELLADFAQKSIVGNYIGSREDMKEMLEFASQHNIKATAEIFPMEKVNDATQKMRKNEISFSLVLTR